MATNLTNFYQRGLDVADVYIGKDEIETSILDRSVDPSVLSDIGEEALIPYTIWGWGSDTACARGVNSTNTCSPVISTRVNKVWRHISSSAVNSSAIKCDGSLWSWGCNVYGMLGDGTTVNKIYPSREVSYDLTWSCVQSGDIFSAAMKSDNTIWAWGSNCQGRIGNNSSSFNCYCSPVQEVTASAWCEMAATSSHVAAIKTEGSLWGWGSNTFGELGNNATSFPNGVCSAVREASSSTDWCQVSTGLNQTGAIKTDGSLWAWGMNFGGQLGDGTTINKCVPTREFTSSTNWCFSAASSFFAGAIKSDNTLWMWGSNCCGRLASGDITDTSSPRQEFTSSTDWNFIDLSVCSASAIKTDGTLWSWGLNNKGQLGDGTSIDKCSPVRETRGFDTWLCVASAYDTVFGLKR
jgi:alpha-tubulin suppressor-like RCC1 family protein